MPLNENTRNYFKRYSKFYLKNDNTCWRVEAIDWISTPGILEVAAVEYYANEFEDDIEQGIVDGLIEEIKDPNEEDNTIIGETFIKVRTPAPFKYKGSQAAIWSVDKKYPVNLSVDKNDERNRKKAIFELIDIMNGDVHGKKNGLVRKKTMNISMFGRKISLF